MSEERDEYPVTGLHRFLQEASSEFRRFRVQAKITLIGSLVIFILVSRFLIYDLMDLGPPPYEAATSPLSPPRPDVLDLLLLVASLVAVLMTVDVWLKQRRFVSRWGERFEKLNALEKQLLPDDKATD